MKKFKGELKIIIKYRCKERKNIVIKIVNDSGLTPGASPSAGDGQIYKMKMLVNKYYENYNN